MTTETDYVVAPFVIDIDFRGSNLGYTFDTSPEPELFTQKSLEDRTHA